MHILIGVGAALVVLYFWLRGHWFARVVVFVGLAVIGAVGGGEIAAHYGERWVPVIEVVAAPTNHLNEDDVAFLMHTGVPEAIARKPEAPATTTKAPIAVVIFGIGTGIVLAWLISGIPVYCHRRGLLR